MRDLKDFLSEREIYIIENHPRLSYAKLGAELDITGNRVAQIKHKAERKIREEKKAEAKREWAKQPVLIPLKRSEWLVVRRALRSYSNKLTPNTVCARTNPKREPDPDIAICERIGEFIYSVIYEAEVETE